MVQIRPVWMRVHAPLVTVPVGVPCGGRSIRVLVIMMPVIVAMTVDVFNHLVRVPVGMLAHEQEPDREHEDPSGYKVQGAQRLGE